MNIKVMVTLVLVFGIISCNNRRSKDNNLGYAETTADFIVQCSEKYDKHQISQDEYTTITEILRHEYDSIVPLLYPEEVSDLKRYVSRLRRSYQKKRQELGLPVK